MRRYQDPVPAPTHAKDTIWIIGHGYTSIHLEARSSARLASNSYQIGTKSDHRTVVQACNRAHILRQELPLVVRYRSRPPFTYKGQRGCFSSGTHARQFPSHGAFPSCPIDSDSVWNEYVLYPVTEQYLVWEVIQLAVQKVFHLRAATSTPVRSSVLSFSIGGRYSKAIQLALLGADGAKCTEGLGVCQEGSCRLRSHASPSPANTCEREDSTSSLGDGTRSCILHHFGSTRG
jgi:hypothetical protein